MIGIFDSGIGGLTVAKAIERTLPNHPFIYYGDTAHTPYGTKSRDTIIDYSLRNTEFLLDKGAHLIVIGCNSASSVATETLRDRFDVPIYEVIGPAAKRAVELSTMGRIGVIGTRATIGSEIYEKTIGALAPSHTVLSEPCPLLVPLVEENWCNRQETKMIIRRYLQPLREKQIDTLILGCTHYPQLKELIQKRVGKKVTLIDSSEEIARVLKKQLISGPPTTERSSSFYFSDITASVQLIASSIFGRNVEILAP